MKLLEFTVVQYTCEYLFCIHIVSELFCFYIYIYIYNYIWMKLAELLVWVNFVVWVYNLQLVSFQFMALLGEKNLTEDGCRRALQCSRPYVSGWIKHAIAPTTAWAIPSAGSLTFSFTLVWAFRPWNVSRPAVHAALAFRHNSLCNPTGMHFFFFVC